MRNALALALAAGTGCMTGSGDMGDSGDMDRMQSAVASATTRLDQHRTAVAQTDSPELVRVETDAYAQDMDAQLDAMMDSCGDMMSGGMMGGSDYDETTDRAEAMRALVQEHRTRMAGTEDLAEMRAACDEHHAAMSGMMDDMSAQMDAMGSGMMGGGHGGMM